jgi:hypothetical protein
MEIIDTIRGVLQWISVASPYNLRQEFLRSDLETSYTSSTSSSEIIPSAPPESQKLRPFHIEDN